MENKKYFLTNKKIKEKVNSTNKIDVINNRESFIYKKDDNKEIYQPLSDSTLNYLTYTKDDISFIDKFIKKGGDV